ncbi:MAG: HU family DNA-binding protein, partial [Prevotellaceae bacterium]|nr:HU family DNA-binding protein [Prevotellaceae bacterium]
MNDKISLQDLAQGLARRKDMTKKDAESFVRKVFDIIEENVVADGQVKIKTLGTFKVITVDSRESVDISTGERIVIDTHPRLSFTPAATLRDAVNRPFADFQTVVLNDATSTEEMEFTPVVPPIEADEIPLLNESVPQAAAQSVAAAAASDDNAGLVVESTELEQAAEPEETQELAEPAEPAESLSPAEEQVEPHTSENPETHPEQAKTGQSGVVTQQTVGEMSVRSQYVEQQIIKQVVSSAVEEELARRRHHVFLSRGAVAFIVLLVLVLVAAAFCLGYLYGGGDWHFGQQEQSAQPARESVEVPPQEAESIAPQTADVSSEPDTQQPTEPTAEQLAKDYPQVEGGDYWITGTLEEHTIVVGDNLYALAQKTYGDKRCAAYIIKFNSISDPDRILLGYKI